MATHSEVVGTNEEQEEECLACRVVQIASADEGKLCGVHTAAALRIAARARGFIVGV